MASSIHELSLGSRFDNLIVEVHEILGVDKESKPNDPVYTAIVKDATGYARLVYRSSNSCRALAVKRSKVYSITGKCFPLITQSQLLLLTRPTRPHQVM